MDNFDIDVDAKQHAHYNPEQRPQDLQTFDEMYNYLIMQQNCSIQGSHFTVPDLHLYLKLAHDRVNLIDYSERNTNIMCTTAKRSMKRVFHAFLESQTDVVGMYNKKPFSSH